MIAELLSRACMRLDLLAMKLEQAHDAIEQGKEVSAEDLKIMRMLAQEAKMFSHLWK